MNVKENKYLDFFGPIIFTLAAFYTSQAFAFEEIIGRWEKCSLDCSNDDLACWTSERLELEWYTQTGESVYISGPELNEVPRESLPFDIPDHMTDIGDQLRRISHFELFASISGYTIEGSRITFETGGDSEPFTAVLGNMEQNRYSYSFSEDDGTVVTVEMCRVDQFSPLFEGLSNYLNAMNTLDSSFESISLVAAEWRLSSISTDNDPDFLFPIALVSSDRAFAILLDPLNSGTAERSNSDANIFRISSSITLVVNLLNDSITTSIIHNSFRSLDR